MGYEQHMKHWKNHRKDKFLQQCSGPSHEPTKSLTEVQKRRMDRMRFRNMIGKVGNGPFPIFIRQGSGGIWFTTSERDCFGHRIESRKELLEFYESYI